MTDAFNAMVAKHKARMQELKDAFDLDLRLLAVSTRNPAYSILLSRNSDPSSVFRVTSFDGKIPTAHREYDHLDGRSHINSALAEFLADDLRLVRRVIPKRERERRIKEAREGLQACADAILKTPDDAGKAIFERSQRIWQKRLKALNS